MPEDRRPLLWLRTRRLTALLLAIWLLASLAGPWFARTLNALHIVGVPLGYWLAAQGLLVFFLLVILVYVVWMNLLESRFRNAAPTADDSRAPSDSR